MEIFTSIKIISEIELQTILIIKRKREEKGISRQELSKKIGVAHSFVGKVESLSFPDKYNIRHLGLIAKAFGLKSVRNLLPDSLPTRDQIKITFKKVPKTNKDGSVSKQMEEKIIQIVGVS